MIKKITLLMMLLPVFGFGQLATFNFFGATEVATINAASVDANLNQTVTMTRGAGAAPSAGGNSFRTVGFMNDGIDVNNTDYFQFQLEALAGFKMSLTSIDAQVRGTASFLTSNSNGGALNQFAYSLDGITFTLIGSPLLVTVNNSALPSTDLSAVAALQNVAAGTVVTFRFYATGQTATGGWGFTSGSATTEDFVVDGTSAAVGGNPCATIAAPVAPSTSVCSGNMATLTATASETGSTLSWFDVATGGVAVGTGLTFQTPVLTSTTSYWVEEALPGCPASDRTEVIVNISGFAPVASATSNSPICAGETLNLTANTVVNATYGWTGPNAFTSAVQNPTIPNATALASGTYTLSITAGGCAAATSTVVVAVNANPVVTTTLSGLTLTASVAGSTYEWYNCADNAVVGSNLQTYTATTNGSYAVEITDANGCVGSSTCQVINTVGVDAKTAINSFSMSPNPTKGKVTITAAFNESANVVIFNALGKEVSRIANIQNGSVIDFSAFNNGVYMVQITNSKGTKVQRVVKN